MGDISPTKRKRNVDPGPELSNNKHESSEATALKKPKLVEGKLKPNDMYTQLPTTAHGDTLVLSATKSGNPAEDSITSSGIDKAKRKAEKKRRKAEAAALKKLQMSMQTVSIPSPIESQTPSPGIQGSVEQRSQHTTDSTSANSKSPQSPNKPGLKSPTKDMDSPQKAPLAVVDSNTTAQSLPLPASAKAPTSSTSALKNPSKPKKSVKFSADTAPTDGDSRERIHKAILGSYASAAIVTPEDLASSLDAAAPPKKKQKREKKKRDKTKNGKGGAGGGNDGNAKEAALAYLLEYHRSRDTWKFQKSKQNWLLRNLFDVEEIQQTKENNAALKAYIAGLQSVEARGRILEEARKIVAAGEAKDDAAKVKKDGEGDVEMGNSAATGDKGGTVKEKKPGPEQVKRARIVIAGLGHGDEDEEEEEEEERNKDKDKEDSKEADDKSKISSSNAGGGGSDTSDDASDEEDSDDSADGLMS